MNVLIAVSIVALLGMTGLTIDLGMLLLKSRTLQATTDDAALAGAITLPNSNATTMATQFSAVSGNGNARPLLNASTMTSGYPLVKCISALQNQGFTCGSPAQGNAVQVKQQMTAPLLFMSLLGFKQSTIAASSTARTGFKDLSTGVLTYNVNDPSSSAYSGQAVNTYNNGISGGWIVPSNVGYTDEDVAWIVPPGGGGNSGFYPTDIFTYTSVPFSGIIAITQGMINADDTVALTLYDITSGNATQVGATVVPPAPCGGGGSFGSYCNSPFAFSFSGLLSTHTYRLIATVSNAGGGPTGLVFQAIGYSPAALYIDQ